MTLEDDYVKVRDFKLEGEIDWKAIFKEYGPRVIRLISLVLDTYMDMDDDDREIVTAWICMAAFKDAVDTCPILYINGAKGSGKTRLEKLIAAMIPKSLMTLNLTESSLFRLHSIVRCLLIDEAERKQISNNERDNLTELLNACYKRGGQVVRMVKRKDGDYEPRYFPVYNPVVLANIWGLAGVIEDRAITVVLKRTRNMAKSRLSERFESDPIIQAIKHWLSEGCEGSGGVPGYTLGGAGLKVPLYIYNIHIPSLPSLSFTSEEEKEFLAKSERVNVNGRDFELWSPIWQISFTFSNPSLDRLFSIAETRTKEKQEEGLEFDRDTSVLVMLKAYLTSIEDTRVIPKDFRLWYLNSEQVPEHEHERHWLTNEWIGRWLKRSKIVLRKGHTNRGNYYIISKSKLDDSLEACGASDYSVEDVVPVSPSQRHIVDSTPNSAQPEAKGEAQPSPPPSKSKADAVPDRPDLIPAASADKAKPLAQPRQGSPNFQGENPPGIESRNPAQAQNPGKGHGICDRCGKSAPLYYYPYSDPVSLACVDCMNLAQHREED